MSQKMQEILFEHIEEEILQELKKGFEVFCAKLLKVFEKYGAVFDYVGSEHSS
ncbi:27817_t:CDS:2 [Gigaspora margarita]|uniref:27817_t:CDS:1 n=1 Tax=Gigaspora margarita TaxID=4874 RepID=A0ABN7V143_GIGMA|nr:27817_t:CDS:2 [Gigaspora margarita]